MFRGGAAYVYESPLSDSSLVMNIHNPFRHCITSQYMFKPRDVIMPKNRISVATITYATALLCRVPLNGMFHQDSATQWNKLRIWKISNFGMSNSLGKRHLNSVWTQYVCDKSENARACAKWQWNALDWCYWIALSIVTHIRVSELGQHELRRWLVGSSLPSLCLNQCWIVINCTLKNKLQLNLNQGAKTTFTRENAFKIPSVKCPPCYLGGNGFRWHFI